MLFSSRPWSGTQAQRQSIVRGSVNQSLHWTLFGHVNRCMYITCSDVKPCLCSRLDHSLVPSSQRELVLWLFAFAQRKQSATVSSSYPPYLLCSQIHSGSGAVIASAPRADSRSTSAPPLRSQSSPLGGCSRPRGSASRGPRARHDAEWRPAEDSILEWQSRQMGRISEGR